jgi:hypothetical protein
MVYAKNNLLVKLASVMAVLGLMAACADQRGFRPQTFSTAEIRAQQTGTEGDPRAANRTPGRRGGHNLPWRLPKSSNDTQSVDATATQPKKPDAAPADPAVKNEKINNAVRTYLETTRPEAASQTFVDEFIKKMSTPEEAGRYIIALSPVRLIGPVENKYAVSVEAQFNLGDGKRLINIETALDAFVELQGKNKVTELHATMPDGSGQPPTAPGVKVWGMFCTDEDCAKQSQPLLILLVQIDIGSKKIFAIFGQQIEDRNSYWSTIRTPFDIYQNGQDDQSNQQPKAKAVETPIPRDGAPSASVTGAALENSDGDKAAEQLRQLRVRSLADRTGLPIADQLENVAAADDSAKAPAAIAPGQKNGEPPIAQDAASSRVAVAPAKGADLDLTLAEKAEKASASPEKCFYGLQWACHAMGWK